MVRAKPLPPDERRAAIIAAAAPLVDRHGAQVTTAQIAEAAGIAEGTLFRVFATKAEIVVAVIHDAIDPDRAIVEVEAIREPDLPRHVRALLAHFCERYASVSRMFATLYMMGQDGQQAAQPEPGDHHRRQVENQRRLREAVAASLARFSPELAVPAEKAASLLLGFAAISSHGLVADGTLSDPDELCHLFLHGTLKDAR